MFQTKVEERLKMHKFRENRAVYKLMIEDTVQTDRPQMTMLRMCIACWITLATDTHSEYVTVNKCETN